MRKPKLLMLEQDHNDIATYTCKDLKDEQIEVA
jgi:hypothetical protein